MDHGLADADPCPWDRLAFAASALKHGSRDDGQDEHDEREADVGHQDVPDAREFLIGRAEMTVHRAEDELKQDAAQPDRGHGTGPAERWLVGVGFLRCKHGRERNDQREKHLRGDAMQGAEVGILPDDSAQPAHHALNDDQHKQSDCPALDQH